MKILGNFIECANGEHCESLMINFSPTSAPLQQRWLNNGLSADFLADYLGTFFPAEDDKALTRRTEIKDGVNFIANELLENAMKFNDPTSKHPVRLYMGLQQDKVYFYITTSIKPVAIIPWQKQLNRILTEDTNALFIEQITHNDSQENSNSGLGYLTMINDWNASLAWKFESIHNDTTTHRVTVMVQLPI